MMIEKRLNIQFVHQLEDVAQSQWNALVDEHNPFIEYTFLRELEKSRSVGTQESGWHPCHLLADIDGDLVGALPLYAKSHSYGEYIFDWSWARAFQASGVPYYPKLVSAIPFTPATGPRLLLNPKHVHSANLQKEISDSLEDFVAANQFSSAHILFIPLDEVACWERHGYIRRTSFQFHWSNQDGWRHFDDYLGAMRAPYRKQIKKERRQALSHGLNFSIVKGKDLKQEHIDALFTFYRTTIDKKWASAYLTQDFFLSLGGALAHRVVATFAQKGNDFIAGALFFHKGQHLYGRYWGATLPLKALHFELCYYLPIQWCLENGIVHFEAGAQGEHKLKRGFNAKLCYSTHRVQNPGFRDALQRFLPQESQAISREVEAMNEHSPFRQNS
jgi:uncharacterized protein